MTEFSDAGMGRKIKLKEGGMQLDEAVKRVKALLGLEHGEFWPAFWGVPPSQGHIVTVIDHAFFSHTVRLSSNRKTVIIIAIKVDRDHRCLRRIRRRALQRRSGRSILYGRNVPRECFVLDSMSDI